MRRFFQVFAADVFAKVLLALVALALIRFLEPAQYALYTLAVALATAVAHTLAAGFGRVFIIGHASLNLPRQEASFLGLEIALVGLIACSAWPFASALGGVYGATVSLALGIVASEFAKTVFQQRLYFRGYSTVEILRAGLQAGAVVALIAAYRHATEAWTVLFAQGGALLLACALMLAREVEWRTLANVGQVARLGAATLRGRYAVLLGYFAVVVVFSQIDVVMVKVVGGEDALASYGAALRYYALLSLALGAVHAVLLPAIQRAETPADLELLYAQHFRLLLLFVPAVAAAGWAAPWVLPFVDQGRYPQSVPAFQILAASSIVSFAFSPHANVLLTRERFRFLVSVTVLALGLAVGLHVVLIPRYGAPGAAMATLVAAGLANVSVFLAARRTQRGGG